LSRKWAIWLSVGGDLRFASHQDMMRSIQRTAVRAKLPLKYTQGFNPRPVMSLVLPRPVGVASGDDLLTLSLEGDSESGGVVESLNSARPPQGLEFLGSALMGGKVSPQPRRAWYELPLDEGRRKAVSARLEQLALAGDWPVERMVKTRRRRKSAPENFAAKRLNIKPLVEQIRIFDNLLEFTLISSATGGARPAEVLTLCGLDERKDLASVRRVTVDYCVGGEEKDFRAA